MRVFVTGASGYVGSALTPLLAEAGHEVTGLARSDASAQKVEAAGARAQRGSLDDLDTLRASAEAADAVIHLAFVHDFVESGGMEESAAKDVAAIDAIGEVLAGSGAPFITTSGTLIGVGADPITEETPAADTPRAAGEHATLALADRGVRSSVVRLSPSVHSDADTHGFMPLLVQAARKHGVSGYTGDGSNRWSGVHHLDAARLFALALESGEAGAVYNAVADEAVRTGEVAELIGRGLDLPVRSIPDAEAEEHFGFMAWPLGMDAPASSALTRQRLGWEPREASLVEDLKAGHYFA